MNGRSIPRLAALSGVGFFLLAMAGHFIYPSGPDFAAKGAEVRTFYIDHQGALLGANTLYLLSGMLLLVFAAAVRRALRSGEQSEVTATAAFGALIAGAALMIASSAVDMAGALHAQQQGTISPQAASVLWDLNHVLFGLAAPVALAVAVLGAALGSLRDRALPGWLGVISFALGIALAVPPINYVAMVVFIFWPLTVSIVLALGVESADARGPAPARPAAG